MPNDLFHVQSAAEAVQQLSRSSAEADQRLDPYHDPGSGGMHPYLVRVPVPGCASPVASQTGRWRSRRIARAEAGGISQSPSISFLCAKMAWPRSEEDSERSHANLDTLNTEVRYRGPKESGLSAEVSTFYRSKRSPGSKDE